MSKVEKIKRVCLYQSVQFGATKKSETYFSTEDSSNNKVAIEFFSDLLVSIKNDDDHVLVPITNLKSVHFYNKSDKKRAEFLKAEAKKKPTGKAQDIKRPI